MGLALSRGLVRIQEKVLTMKATVLSSALAAMVVATPSAADYVTLRTEGQFRAVVSGKLLTRPLIRLEVLPEGQIRGKGARRDVSGRWNWRDGYFCRDLKWGEKDIGYNCQEVAVKEGRIRFTSDRGTGDSADFRLRGQ